MKIKVLKRFKDKFDKITRYEPGTELDFEDERATDLIERGLAEAAEELAGDEDPEQDENDKSPEGNLEESPEQKTENTEKVESPEQVEIAEISEKVETDEQVEEKTKAKKTK